MKRKLLIPFALLILTACAAPVTATPTVTPSPTATSTATPRPSNTPPLTATLIGFTVNLPHELYLPFIEYDGRLVFASDIYSWGGLSLYWVNSDGSNLTQITFGNDNAPDWSPDGRQIVFTRRLSREELEDIYLLDVATLEVTQITDTPTDESAPSWSPTGEYITYMSSRETSNHYDIYIMKLDERVAIRLTTDDSYEAVPRWSPDGSKILFSRGGVLHTIDTTCLDEPDTCEVNIVEVPIQSDVDFEWVRSGIWSPTGDRIAFSAQAEDYTHIYVMNADGSELRQLTHDRRNVGVSAWSPDGRYITYCDCVGPPPCDLVIMDVICLDSPDGCDEFPGYLLVDDGDAPNGSFGSSWEPIH